jgi:hypothetical protein
MGSLLLLPLASSSGLRLGLGLRLVWEQELGTSQEDYKGPRPESKSRLL